MYVVIFCSLIRRAVLASLCLILSFGGLSAQAASFDLLERPAPLGGQGERAVLLGVTRAADKLIAVGERGLVLVSGDNGVSWQQVEVPVSVALTGVYFADDQHGWIIGHSGVVLHTADGGSTWQRQLDGVQAAQLEAVAAERDQDSKRQRNASRLLNEGADKPWLGALFVDENHGWLIGAYGLFMQTRDGGLSWQSAMGTIDNPAGLHLYAMRAVGDRLVIAGEQGALFQSTDGGQHFTQVPSPYEGSFFGLVSTAKGDLIAYGLRGNAWRQASGSEDWQAITLGNEITLTAALLQSNGILLLADESGQINYSRDDGNGFATLGPIANGYVAGLVEAADGALVTVGARGVQRFDRKQVQP